MIAAAKTFRCSWYVAKAAAGIFGEGTDEMRSAFERWRLLVIAESWPGVCAWVGELLAVADEVDPGRRCKIAAAKRGKPRMEEWARKCKGVSRCGFELSRPHMGDRSVDRASRRMRVRSHLRGLTMISWLRRHNVSPPPSARRVTRAPALNLEALEAREVPAVLAYDTFAVDYSDDFQDSEVRLVDPYTGDEYLSPITPFEGYRGTLTVADGDVDGDGYDDVIVGADGAGGHIRVFDGYNGALLDSYFAFPGFRGDVGLGAGDVNGDGYDDAIAVAEGVSGHVQVFDGYDGALLLSFFAFPGFGGGVSVGAGDVNGDGYDDVIAAADGRGGLIGVFDGYDGALLDSFFAFPGFDGSVSVGAADFLGGGYDQIVVGAGGDEAGGRVAIFDADGSLYSPGFFAFPDFDGEIGLWTGDVDGDGIPDIVVDGWPGTPDGYVEAFSGEDFESIYGYPTY